MTRPIQTGDICLVVDGFTKKKSPNIGLTIVVGKLRGEHSRFGMVYECKGEGICQLSNTGDFIVTNKADFPTSWLKRIKPQQIIKALNEAITNEA